MLGACLVHPRYVAVHEEMGAALVYEDAGDRMVGGAAKGREAAPEERAEAREVHTVAREREGNVRAVT